MKRSLKYFSLLLATLLVLTGCGSKKDAKEQLNDALKKTGEAKSFSAKFEVKGNLSAQGSSTSIGLSGTGDINLKDTPSAHYTSKVSLLGMNSESEGQAVVKDNKVYNYTKEEDGWVYSTEDYKAEDFSTDKLNTLADNAKTVKSVKSDKKGYTKLEVTIDKDKLSKSTEGLNTADLVGTDLKINKDLVVNVYIKDGYVSIIEIDLADLLKDALSGTGTEDMSVSATVSVELTNFGKVSPVTVPEDVEKNAKENAYESDDLDF